MRYAITGATIDQVRSIGGSDIKEARAAGIIFATLTESQVIRLRAMGCQVTPVGQVGTAIRAPVMPPQPVAGVAMFTVAQLLTATGFERLRSLIVPPLYGEGINVAIIDTGIRESHEMLGGRVVYRQNFTGEPMQDGFDHGTGVASIVVAVAPRCNLLNIKVLDDKGFGTEEAVVLGIDELLTMHDNRSPYAPQIINLSLGSPDDGNPANPLRVACRAALARGLWVNAAAGNSGPAPGTIMSPATERYVCATGSCSYEPFVVSGFSARGPTKEGLVKPDIVVFGENIVVASSAADTAAVAKSGTSFATPFVSGCNSLYLEGVGRQLSYHLEKYPQYADQIAAAFASALTPERTIDEFLPRIAVKPQGAPVEKDVDYGYGLPVGQLVLNQMAPRAAVDITALLSGVVLAGMMGMMLSVMDERR